MHNANILLTIGHKSALRMGFGDIVDGSYSRQRTNGNVLPDLGPTVKVF